MLTNGKCKGRIRKGKGCFVTGLFSNSIRSLNTDLAFLPQFLCLLCVRACPVVSDFFVNPWTVAHQAPLSMVFSRQESWSRLQFASTYTVIGEMKLFDQHKELSTVSGT